MLNIFDFAKLSFHVYKNNNQIKKYLGKYVKLDYPMLPKQFFDYNGGDGVYEIMLDPNIQNHYAQTHSLAHYHFGFYASFYVKKQDGRLSDAVIAIRGTNNILNDLEDVKSWWRSVMLDGHASLLTHYNGLALGFYNKASAFCRKYGISSKYLFSTGHSLGGALAALLPAHDGGLLRAVTFNAPGIADMQTVKHAADLVINFRSTFDFVSAVDKPVGNVFPIHVFEKEAKAKRAFEIDYEHRQDGWTRLNIIEDLVEISDFLDSVLAQHSMLNIYEAMAALAHHKTDEAAYFDPYASFDFYERRLILPAPFPTLYPGEAVVEQAAKV